MYVYTPSDASSYRQTTTPTHLGTVHIPRDECYCQAINTHMDIRKLTGHSLARGSEHTEDTNPPYNNNISEDMSCHTQVTEQLTTCTCEFPVSAFQYYPNMGAQ